MLARTADNIFWLARYMERADYVARLLEAAGQMSIIRVNVESDTEWESAIIAAGCEEQFFNLHEKADSANVAHFLASSRDNFSSITQCIETARRNARSVRTSLTADMWEAVNGTWLELSKYCVDHPRDDDLSLLLEWIKKRVGLMHGVSLNAMLRRDSFHFYCIGQYLERADNIARLMDVKYQVTAKKSSDTGEAIDYYQWLAILQVVGARRAYRVLYKGHVQPLHIAELLISRDEFPRSLAYCFSFIVYHLERITTQDHSLTARCKRQAHTLLAQTRYLKTEEVFHTDLHAFLTHIVDSCSLLGQDIAKSFLFET